MKDPIEAYIGQFPEEVQMHLNKVRRTILEAVAGLEEKIAYDLPAYHYRGRPFVYFGAFKNHLGFYATPDVHEHPELQNAMAEYKQGRGSIQFPYKGGIPYELIRKMLQLRKIQIERSTN